MRDLVKCRTCRFPQGANAKHVACQQDNKSGHELAMRKEDTLKQRITKKLDGNV